MSYKDLIELSSALLTPTIAILGAFIAIRQWQTNEAKRRHELFNDRYLHVYLEALNFYITIRNIIYQGGEEDDIQDLLEDYESKLYKYRFFVKESDFVKLQNILSSFLTDLELYVPLKNKKNKNLTKEENEIKRKFELNHYDIEEQIYLIMEKYLRIEKENFIFAKTLEKKLDWQNNWAPNLYPYFPTFLPFYMKIKDKVLKKHKYRFLYRISKIFTKKVF